jgi:DNA-binding response OmpR family regulator
MSAASDPAEARKWVLVVDDDASVRTLFVDVLEDAGYRAVGAEDGYVAEELIRDLFPDLILLDLHMPRGSGESLLNNVRKHPRWRTIPIAIVSGRPDLAGVLDDAGLTIVGRIGKPVSAEDLLATVRRVIGEPHRGA